MERRYRLVGPEGKSEEDLNLSPAAEGQTKIVNLFLSPRNT